jgi:hypothetical protein
MEHLLFWCFLSCFSPKSVEFDGEFKVVGDIQIIKFPIDNLVVIFEFFW